MITGIKDILLFGENYYKEIKADDIEEDEDVVRLKDLQQIIYEKEFIGRLIHLVKEEFISKGVYDTFISLIEVKVN